MELLVQAHKSISDIFNSSPLYLVEDKKLMSQMAKLDFNVVEIFEDSSLSASLDELGNDVVFVISDRDINGSATLHKQLAGRNVLQIPTHAFDGNFDATKYTLEMCSSLDLVDCVARNRSIMEEIASDRKEFSLESTRSTVRFSLYDEVKIMETATERYLTGGNDKALSSYTEVALIPNVIDGRAIHPSLLGYDVSGTFECDGCLIAIHMDAQPRIIKQHKTLSRLIFELHDAEEFPLTVSVQNTQVKSIKTRSGQDISRAFLIAMDDHLAENILELALGTNAGANIKTINWKYNSPINESALGFHMAIGDGHLCPHVDFICADPDAYQSFFARPNP